MNKDVKTICDNMLSSFYWSSMADAYQFISKAAPGTRFGKAYGAFSGAARLYASAPVTIAQILLNSSDIASDNQEAIRQKQDLNEDKNDGKIIITRHNVTVEYKLGDDGVWEQKSYKVNLLAKQNNIDIDNAVSLVSKYLSYNIGESVRYFTSNDEKTILVNPIHTVENRIKESGPTHETEENRV